MVNRLVSVGDAFTLPEIVQLGTAEFNRTQVTASTVVAEAPLTPLHFSAVGDGVTSDDTAMHAWMAALASVPNGAHGYLPNGKKFLTTTPLVVPAGLHLEGSNSRSVAIVNNTSDIFVQSGSISYTPHLHFHDFGVKSGVGGGHVFAFNTVQGEFDNLYLQQDNPAKSCLKTTIWLASTFRDSTFQGPVGRTAPTIEGICTTGNLGDNTFNNLWIQESGTSATTWQIWWEERSGGQASGNVFRDLTLENPYGGGITIRGQFNYLLSGLYLWDIAGPGVNNLVDSRKSVGGQENTHGTIERIIFPAGSMSSGKYVIGLGGPGQEYGTLIRQCPSTGSATLTIQTNRSVHAIVENCASSSVANYYPLLAPLTAAGVGATAESPGVNEPKGLYRSIVSLTIGSSAVTAGDLLGVSSNENGWMLRPPKGVGVIPMNAAAAAAGLYTSGYSPLGFNVSTASVLAPGTVLLFAYNVLIDIY